MLLQRLVLQRIHYSVSLYIRPGDHELRWLLQDHRVVLLLLLRLMMIAHLALLLGIGYVSRAQLLKVVVSVKQA